MSNHQTGSDPDVPALRRRIERLEERMTAPEPKDYPGNPFDGRRIPWVTKIAEWRPARTAYFVLTAFCLGAILGALVCSLLH
jgi:hypothetical protein